MDGGEIWAAHMSNSKPQYNLHHQPSSHSAHLDQHINLDDVDGDEDVRSDFSCPYCYEDFDLTSLCSHLEDEHCFEFKPAICPVCAAKIGKDMVGHVTLQHANLLKISFLIAIRFHFQFKPSLRCPAMRIWQKERKIKC
ncbi:unnamed protein product [Sphagnum compactum]